MQKQKKEYKINDNLTSRLTEKSGVTDEIIEFLNSLDNGKIFQEIVKAIKYWIRTKHVPDRYRREIEEETLKMELNLRRYGRNRSTYNKKDHSEKDNAPKEVQVLTQQELPEFKKVDKITVENIVSPSEESSVDEKLDDSSTYNNTSSYEDELFGVVHNTNNVISINQSNPMGRALASIPKRG